MVIIVLFIKSLNVSFHNIKANCNNPEFQEWYAIYKQAFPFEEIQENPEAFEQIYLLTQDAEIQRLYGSYTEITTIIRRGKKGKIIGGLNFGIVSSPQHIETGCFSIHATYIFFAKEHRGLIPMSVIVDYMRQTAAEIYGHLLPSPKYKPVILFEVENPLLLSSAQIEQDIEYSGVNPYRRYLFWQKAVCARPLGFPYIQPALNAGVSPSRYLELFVITELNAIPAKLLYQHLFSFDAISVIKNTMDIRKNPEFKEMSQWLSDKDVVGLLSSDSAKIQEINRQARLQKQEQFSRVA